MRESYHLKTVIDHYPDEQYQKAVQFLKDNPEWEKPAKKWLPLDLLFITSDNQFFDCEYESYPIFDELGISKDDFQRWMKYMALDRESVEYTKAYRECICNMAAWQWKFSRLLDKRQGLIMHNIIQHQYMMKLQELDTKLGLGFPGGYV